MVLNKKAMFFTLVIILLLSLFVISYSFYFVVRDKDVVSKRVDTMQNFIFSIEENLERELYAFGFRTIFLVENKITETGDYIINLDNYVQEAFFNGTFSGEYSSILEGINYEDLKDKLNQKGNQVNLNIEMSNPQIYFGQEDPWHVFFDFSFDINFSDQAGEASWSRNQNIRTYVDIEGFEDPLYLIGTYGKVTNKINQTSYSFPDISNLLAHTEKGDYIYSPSAPSFLDRLKGINSPNENGIESLVYIPDLLSQEGVPIKEKSVVDYIYFSDNNPISQNVAPLPFWFRIDANHLPIYVG